MDAAKELLAQGKVDEARSQVDELLARDPVNVNALLFRSTLRTREGEQELALADAEKAVRLSGGSAEAQLRRAISFWRLKQYGRAKGVAQWLDDSQAATMWKSMIAARPEPEEHVDAIPAAGAARPEPPRVPQAEPQAQPVASPQAVAPARAAALPPAEQPRIDWYQTGDVVHLTVYRKGLDAETSKIIIAEKELAISGSDFKWALVLGNSIAADSSTYDITPYKVDFSLKKAANVRWSSLESTEDALAPPVAQAKPTPQTSYSKWDHLDADDEEEKNGSDPNAFFQELYKSSSPDVQRAMMKSFVESNGTALSTNWDEVKQGKVETQPPKDMEARSWN